MENTYLSITSISEQIGFNDVNYFSKIFKEFLGISPSEYRKILKEESNSNLK